MDISIVVRRPAWTLAGTLAFAVMLGASATHAADRSFERFYGDFEGQAISTTNGELSPRDLEVSIGPTDKGFFVKWTAVIYKASGKVKRTALEVNFARSKRERVYRSAMRTNMFGQQVPLDPLEGDPYFWATIEGDTLSVRGLLIVENGGYELQEYNRTLTDDGMALDFVRVRNGERLRTVEGKLIRRR
ncbi:MAG: hypothetical protein ACR2RL_01790 [Gammaproteobacteria bacterium]